MKSVPLGLFSISALILMFSSGCMVPQAPGQGKMLHRVEARTNAGYWLYLPEDYVRNLGRRPDRQRWPLVVTFHGMRPWDDAQPQIREWQQEADRYNFIVISPDLRTCDSLMQYPLRDPNLWYVKKDEEGTLAIMDEVCRNTNADPTRVLATSWSSGGYLAHFMVNRHPERFSCLAVRQSNFSADLLNPNQVPRYRHMRIAIFFGENDFAPCRNESIEAVEWYRQYRFNVQAKYVTGLGHERTPQTAAAFFAATHGSTPKTPPNLGNLVMKDIPPEELSKYAASPGMRRAPAPSNTVNDISTPRRPAPSGSLVLEASPPAPQRVPPAEGTRRAPPTQRPAPTVSETPPRKTLQPY
ncbi:MAG: prolyl oligopeptidase family serine peptidase [Gemmataceae bacterium]|nr:prolyl oligopeptidase family serine peptidase [Gemmataceae bacterium]